MVQKLKASNQVNGNFVSKLIVGALVLFFVFFGWRKEINPSFLQKVIPLKLLDVIIFPISLLPFVVLLFSFIYTIRNVKRSRAINKNKIYARFDDVLFKIAPWILGSLAIWIIAMDLTKSSARHRVKSFLDEVSAQVTVFVNGELAKNPNKVITELKKIVPITPHHSHDTKRIPIEVISRNEKLLLELGRDSTNDQEYWVFYPKYRYTSKNEIGRIITSLFDDY